MSNQVSLGGLVTIKGGGTPSRNNPSYWGGSVPWATVKDLTSPVLSSTQESITTDAVKSSATNIIPAGAIITATRMGLGKAAINTVDIAINQDLKALQPKSNLDSRYLLHFLLSKASFIEAMGKGATVKGILLEDLKQLQIPLPPLAEQKRIAAILDKADAIRRKRQAAIKLADDSLRATFLDMFGDTVTNPKGWEVKKLKEISTHILSGTTPMGGKKVYVENGVTFFRSQNVWRNRLSLDNIAYIDNENHRKMKKSSLKNKDILMTKTGRINTENSSLGRAAMFLGQDDSANINGHVYLIRLQKAFIHEYVLYILTTDEYREYIRGVCVGGIDKRQINKEHLEEFPIIFPPLDLQQHFATIAETANQMKARLLGHLTESDTLFASLTQSAFRGEL